MYFVLTDEEKKKEKRNGAKYLRFFTTSCGCIKLIAHFHSTPRGLIKIDFFVFLFFFFKRIKSQ